MVAPNEPPLTVGLALRNARRSVRWSQAELGSRLGVSRLAVSRWESRVALPGDMNRIALLGFARGLPAEVGHPLRRALGDVALIAVGPPAAPPPPPPPPPPIDPKVIDDAVLRAAEALDVRARAFRVAVDTVLAAIARAGANVADARAIVLPAEPPPA